jgi:hypothetical protein
MSSLSIHYPPIPFQLSLFRYPILKIPATLEICNFNFCLFILMDDLTHCAWASSYSAAKSESEWLWHEHGPYFACFPSCKDCSAMLPALNTTYFVYFYLLSVIFSKICGYFPWKARLVQLSTS